MGSKLFGWSMRILFGLVVVGITAFVLSQPIWSLIVAILSYALGAVIYSYKYACDTNDSHCAVLIGFIWPIIVLLNWSTFDCEKDAALEELPVNNVVTESTVKCHLCDGKLKNVTLIGSDKSRIVEAYCPRCEVKPRLINDKVEFSTEDCLYLINPYNL